MVKGNVTIIVRHYLTNFVTSVMGGILKLLILLDRIPGMADAINTLLSTTLEQENEEGYRNSDMRHIVANIQDGMCIIRLAYISL